MRGPCAGRGSEPGQCLDSKVSLRRHPRRPFLFLPLFTKCVKEEVFSEVQGLGRLRLRIQEAHGSHLGPRIEPEVLYTLILYFLVAHH